MLSFTSLREKRFGAGNAISYYNLFAYATDVFVATTKLFDKAMILYVY